MSNYIIKVEKLGKKYRIRHQQEQQRYVALRDVIANGVKGLASQVLEKGRHLFSRDGTSNHQPSSLIAPDAIASSSLPASGSPFQANRPLTSDVRPLASEDFWALRDMSFEVKQGEVLGIIGRNGAGKSTLLKILSRITKPTEGRVRLRGRVASLLEVGTGFHPELTGRENVFLNGAVLGMTREEIKKKFDEIVAFAEVEKFLDTPVKRYSSGMYVRLAFAVAAHLEPEILVVDEVLAVGDALFQKKCLGKMHDVSTKGGRTVLFVSHNMEAVARLCSKALWVDRGKLLMDGDTKEIISQYMTSNASSEGRYVWDSGIANVGVSGLKIRSVRIVNHSGKISSSLDSSKVFFVDIQYGVRERLAPTRVGFALSTAEGNTVFESYDCDDEQGPRCREPGDYRALCEVPPNLLSPGRYVLSLNAGMPNVKNLAYLEGVLTLSIEDTGSGSTAILSHRDGIIRPVLKWQEMTTACTV